MKALLLGLAAAVLMASPAIAQTTPTSEPPPAVTPVPSPLPAPPPAPVQITNNIDLDRDPGDGSNCRWYQVKCQWQEMKEDTKREWRSKARESIQQSLVFVGKLVISPNPFDSPRIRELWLKVGIPLAGAIVTVLFAWACAKGSLGNPHHMTQGELVGRAGIALGAGAGSIFAIPWFLNFCNEIALMIGFADLIQMRDLTKADDNLFVVVLAYLVMLPAAFVLVCFLLFRWLLLTLWCVASPIGPTPYTLPTTEDVSFTYAKGLAVMIGAPIVEILLISVMVIIVNTGHGVWGEELGAWIDPVLLLGLFIVLLMFELYVVKTVLGIGNRLYVQTKQALRSTRSRGRRWANEGGY